MTLIFATMWHANLTVGLIGRVGVASVCTVTSGLIRMRLNKKIAAGILGAMLVVIQLVIDIVVLGLAGQFCFLFIKKDGK